MIKWVPPLLMILIAFVVVSLITSIVVELGGANDGQPLTLVQSLVRPNEEVRGGQEGFNGYAIDQLLRPLIVIASIVVVIAPLIAWFKKRRMLRYYPTSRL